MPGSVQDPLQVHAASARQPDREDTVWGPAARIARDSAGNWTKAAEGFARKVGKPVDQLKFAVKGSREITGTMPAGALTEPSEEYLFDIKKDPGEQNNLLKQNPEKYNPIKDDLHAQLHKWMGWQADWNTDLLKRGKRD